MRSIILAMLLALCLGLAGAPSASAVPANGAAIGSAADATAMTEQVYHWRRRHHWHGRHRSHWRWGSRWRGPRCFTRHRHWNSRIVRICRW